jgi:glycogen operon protein
MRRIRNAFALLMLSNGTPMFRMGDEFGQAQGGNNNPYNQDNETSWLDWDRLAANRDLFRFFKLMIAFRKAHPSLGRSRFWRDDVRWYGVGPAVDLSPDSRSLAFCIRGASAGDADIYAMVNSFWGELTFRHQEWEPGRWRLVADTSRESPGDVAEPGMEVPVDSPDYRVGPRSVVVLVRSR